MPELSGRSVAYAFVEHLLNDRPSVEDEEVPIVFENDDYRPEHGEPFIKIEWRPGPKQSTIDGRVVWETGGVRIECKSPLHMDALYMNALCDEIESKFNPGQRVVRSGDDPPWTITVLTVGRTMAKRLAGWYMGLVDVNYHAVRAV